MVTSYTQFLAVVKLARQTFLTSQLAAAVTADLGYRPRLHQRTQPFVES